MISCVSGASVTWLISRCSTCDTFSIQQGPRLFKLATPVGRCFILKNDGFFAVGTLHELRGGPNLFLGRFGQIIHQSRSEPPGYRRIFSAFVWASILALTTYGWAYCTNLKLSRGEETCEPSPFLNATFIGCSEMTDHSP